MASWVAPKVVCKVCTRCERTCTSSRLSHLAAVDRGILKTLAASRADSPESLIACLILGVVRAWDEYVCPCCRRFRWRAVMDGRPRQKPSDQLVKHCLGAKQRHAATRNMITRNQTPSLSVTNHGTSNASSVVSLDVQRCKFATIPDLTRSHHGQDQIILPTALALDCHFFTAAVCVLRSKE
jgi:hypothetical protein